MKRSFGTLAVGTALALAVALTPAAASGGAALDAPGSLVTQTSNSAAVAAESSGSALPPHGLPFTGNTDTAYAAVRVGAGVGTEGLYGSGTIIGHATDGSALVLTAEHVTNGDETVVHLGEFSVSVEKITCGPWWADLCVLKLEESLPFVTAKLAVLAEGDTVHFRGATSGLVTGEVLTMDLVMQLDGYEGRPGSEGVRGGLSELTAQNSGGDSGGGVFDSSGRLVGVVIGYRDADNHALVFSGLLFPDITGRLLREIETS